MTYSSQTLHDLLDTFLAINVVGLLLVTGQFLTFCSADSLNRHPTLINLMGTMDIYSAIILFMYSFSSHKEEQKLTCTSDLVLIMVPGSSESEVALLLLYFFNLWGIIM